MITMLIIPMVLLIVIYLAEGSERTKTQMTKYKEYLGVMYKDKTVCYFKKHTDALEWRKSIRKIERLEQLGVKALILGISGCVFGIAMFVIGYLTAL